MAFVGLTTQQLDAFCEDHVTLRAALENWSARSGPHAWNMWQKGFQQFVRRYRGQDPAAALPVAVAPATWALQQWTEVSEAIYGPDWRTMELRTSVGVEVAEGRASRAETLGIPPTREPQQQGAPPQGGAGVSQRPVLGGQAEGAWGLQRERRRDLEDADTRSAPDQGFEQFE